MYTLGLDIGSSSIKVALVTSDTNEVVQVIKEPKEEMKILSPNPNWAEQKPEDWWHYTCEATQKLLKESKISSEQITAIGIAYQMHGLVLIDHDKKVLRNAIIWCDSRAVEIGETAYRTLGKEKCDQTLLNSPANFTASKLKWIKENEPGLFKKTYKFMLPGDYIGYKLTGKIATTATGLSEGILWDFQKDQPANFLLDHYQIPIDLLPELVKNFTVQGRVTKEASKLSGLAEGTPITYRAGDQPNNALSLQVLEPGEVAATAGTSGVLYAVTDSTTEITSEKINSFIHVNHTTATPRIGKLLCVNGCGIAFRWLKEHLGFKTYQEMNELAASVSIGSDGLIVLPFGNGAERIFNNKDIGSHFLYLNYNIHHKAHVCRAVLEGIAFSFVYGMELLKKTGFHIKVIKAGNDNLFQSPVFSETITTLIEQPIQIHDTTGAVGAAKASIIKSKSKTQNHKENSCSEEYTPLTELTEFYQKAYQNWKKELKKRLV
ncbi:xylulokinase [Aquimarina celericrescens]|uniref:Xylulokinase n=1 Tax=Aquimarina celericrescens TaxID=1964542 RepID=A0ABW5AZI8_9FLAO|nr:carbohydrate kinase [Aquimarina celericrescens]